MPRSAPWRPCSISACRRRRTHRPRPGGPRSARRRAARSSFSRRCFSLDSFGGGFIYYSLLVTWLLGHFGLGLTEISTLLTGMQMLSAASQLVAPAIARRIGLVNTMVFTHLPSNLCLVLAPFAPTVELLVALLLLRSALGSMDVPPRTALVMSLVEPHERAAAASFTDVPRSLAAAVAPLIAGWLLAMSPFGWFVVSAAASRWSTICCCFRSAAG
jgi:predicted MFS family arabinose efflux permease